MPKSKLDTAVDPSGILDQDFDLARRGFDRHQVRSYLAAVADSLHDAQRREADMRSRLGRAVRRAETAEQHVRDTEANTQVGDDVTGVLDAARVTAEERLEAARRSAERLLENAKADADRIRAEAEHVLDQRRAEAADTVQDIIAASHADADSIRTQARSDAQSTKLDAADRLQLACDHSDALIREADEARGQILEDMDRRRRQARAQVERLRVGRDRLLRSYDVVRRTLDESTAELKGSLKEAKIRADSAARVVAAEQPATREQLEDELRDAKLIGRINTSGPAPERDPDAVLRSPALPRRLDPPAPVVDLRDSVTESLRPLVAETAKLGSGPKAPAVAPTLNPTPPGEGSQALDPIAAMMQAVDAKHGKVIEPDPADEPLDPELAQLADDDLDVVELSDEIEEVNAVPLSEDAVEGDAEDEGSAGEASQPDPAEQYPGIEAQRDAVIADAAKRFETQLKHALAEEQNELLAGIRSSTRGVELTSLVGDFDQQVNRYVAAINEVAAVTYGAGAALIDAQALQGHLPAGAVEELLAADVILPLRERLDSLADLDGDTGDSHVDHVRSVYLQRTNDHLGFAASRLANLLCVAGLCDALPDEASVPWDTAATPRPESAAPLP